jgi:hypothetical protein
MGKKKQSKRHMDTMGSPNHGVDVFITKTPGKAKTGPRYPLLHIAKGTGRPEGLAFVDDVYKTRIWPDRGTTIEDLDSKDKCYVWDELIYVEAPPTWMDPEMFVRFAKADPRVRKIAMRYKKKGDAGNMHSMQELVSEIFEEVYVGYLLEQFDEVRHLLAEWLVANAIAKETEY